VFSFWLFVFCVYVNVYYGVYFILNVLYNMFFVIYVYFCFSICVRVYIFSCVVFSV
jgi:hypothetical protein